MKPITTIFAFLAFTTFFAAPSMAACPDTAGAAPADAHKGISQDGTHVPLENNANSKTQNLPASSGTTTTSKEANAQTQKDGNTMPMAADKNQATSDQDVAAQQKGDTTAAATADAAKDCVE